MDGTPADVEAVLAYYNDHVADSLALAYSVADLFPIEILNEVRNAVGHLARAAAGNLPTPARAEQCLQARRHLLRVRLDCAKLCQLTEFERLDEDLEVLHTNVRIPTSLSARAEDLKNRRRVLMGREALEPSDHLVDDFLEIFRDVVGFRAELRDEYGDLVVAGYRKALDRQLEVAHARGRREGRRSTLSLTLAVGFATSIIGGLLVALVMSF